MATSKKKSLKSQVQAIEAQVETELTPEEVQAAIEVVEAQVEEDEVALSLASVQAPDVEGQSTRATFEAYAHRRILWMDCPLYPANAKNPQLRVGFCLDNLYEQIGGRRAGDNTFGARMLLAMAPLWEGWNFVHPTTREKLPVPTPGDIVTMINVYLFIPDLFTWLQPAYNAALERAVEEGLGETGGRA